MNVAKPALVSAIVVAGMVVTSAFAWPHAPAIVPVHWSLDGAVDRWGPRWEGLGVTPAITAALAALLAGLPALMPERASLERSATAYAAIWYALLGLLQVLHAALVAQALGLALDMTRIIAAAVGLLFVVLGNYLGKVRYNYVVGIRVPWTLASERVWDRTHRFAGPWVMVAGVAMIAAAGLAPAPLAGAALIACALLPMLAATVYAYRLSRAEAAL